MEDLGQLDPRIFDTTVGHRLALLRYESGLTERVLAIYDAALADIRTQAKALAKRIADGDSVDRRQLLRLQATVNELRTRRDDLAAKINGTLSPALAEVADSEAAWMARTFRSVGVSFTAIPDTAVALALASPLGGRYYAERVAEDLRLLTTEIQDAVAIGLSRGDSMPDIARQLKRMGQIEETYRGRLVAIARTETQRVANATALAGYQANDDVVAGAQWLATLDSRTCVVCAAQHNGKWTLAQTRTDPAFRPPPLHPRCRCALSPLLFPMTDAQGRVLPTFNATPAMDTTFDAWLKRQPVATQVDVLGGKKQRAMWNAGLPLGRFGAGTRVLGLGELRARYPDFIRPG